MVFKVFFAAFSAGLCGSLMGGNLPLPIEQMLEKSLPRDYEQIPCLRSQVVQDPDNPGKWIGPYIDTKYCPSSTKTHLQMKFRGYYPKPWNGTQRKGDKGEWPFAFGCCYEPDGGRDRKFYFLQMGCVVNDQDGYFNLGYGNSAVGCWKKVVSPYGEHTVDFTPTSWKIDSVEPTTPIGDFGGDFESGLSLYVFARRTDTRAPVEDTYAAMALYSMTLGDIDADGVETVRRKFVPCRRRSDGMLGLYDVSGGAVREGFDPFFTNGDTSGKTSFWSEDADKLPKEYCRLWYIRSTASGQQYINTRFKPNSNTCADFRFEMNDFSADYASPFGSRNSGERQFFVAAARVNNRNDYFCRQGKVLIDMDSNGRDTKEQPGRLGFHDFTLNQQAYFLDGWPNRFCLKSDGYTKALFDGAYDAYIFAVNNNDAMSMPAPMDLYSLAIWDNSVLARNFVPCRRREDGKVGLYDTVGHVFYTNANSNGEDFIPGPQRYPDGLVVMIR